VQIKLSSCKIIIRDEVNIKIEGLAVDVRRKLSNALKFELPYARHMPQYKLGRWDGTTTFFGLGGNGYLNHLDVVLPILEECGVSVNEIDDQRNVHDFKFEKITENYWADKGKVWPTGHPIAGQPIVLRDYQLDAINGFMEHPQGLQELATGAGKTIITATLSALCEPYGRTLVIVPNKGLVVQTEEDYVNVGLDVGVYFGDRKELGRTHTICTWQSLNILDKKSKGVTDTEILTLAELLDGVVCVIVDEVHMAKAEVLKKLLSENLANAPIRWGLTGTVPKEEINFHSILATIGPVVNRISAHTLQQKGVLSQCHVNVVQLIDVKEFRSYQEELKYLVSDSDRIGYIAKMCNGIKETGNTLILVDRLDAGKQLEAMIADSIFISGAVKLTERKEEYDEIRTSTNKVIIATYGVAAVGLNIPRIFNLVLLEPGKSFVRVIQSIGRGIRKAEDKDFVQIWDITSTCKYAKRHLTERKKFYKEAKYPFTLEKVTWE
jgi:superfamily II DNA or RNA helicase